MRWGLVVLALVAVLAAAPITGRGPLIGLPRVIDGDTVRLWPAGIQLRFWGVDVPEANTAAGGMAAAALVALIEGAPLFCWARGRDRYGRHVARCLTLLGTDPMRVLVEAGHACDWPRYSGGFYQTPSGCTRAHAPARAVMATVKGFAHDLPTIP